MPRDGALASSRRFRKRQATRDRLVACATELFVDRGYDATSLDDIAEAADVAKGTLFNYFQRKDDLVAAWVEERRLAIRQVLDELDPVTDTVETVRAMLAALARLYEADVDVSRPMVRIWLQNGGPLLAEASETAGLFAEVLRRGVASGEVLADLETSVAARVFLDAYLGVLYRWAGARAVKKRALQSALFEMADVVLNGVIAPRNRTSVPRRTR